MKHDFVAESGESSVSHTVQQRIDKVDAQILTLLTCKVTWTNVLYFYLQDHSTSWSNLQQIGNTWN